MALTVNPLGKGPHCAGRFGAELLGADLRAPPDAELIDTFEEAMARYAVVVVRDQIIDDAEQIRFARAFGPLELPPHMGIKRNVAPRIGVRPLRHLEPRRERRLPADRLVAHRVQQGQRAVSHRQLFQHAADQVVDAVSARRAARGWQHRVLRCARGLRRAASEKNARAPNRRQRNTGCGRRVSRAGT